MGMQHKNKCLLNGEIIKFLVREAAKNYFSPIFIIKLMRQYGRTNAILYHNNKNKKNIHVETLLSD